MTYQDVQRQNAQRTSALVVLRVAAMTSAAAPAPAMIGLLAPPIIAGATRAVLLADLGLAAWLTKRTDRPVPTIGLTLPTETQDAITQGSETIVSDFEENDDADELTMRAERLANAAPLSAGQDAYQDAAEAHGLTAWVRKLTGPSDCSLCKHWADGKARPYSVKMSRHPGCDCVAEPVTPGEGWTGELITGAGIAGKVTTYARPGLTFERSAFVGRQGGQAA
jgi:hypothetical protein